MVLDVDRLRLLVELRDDGGVPHDRRDVGRLKVKDM